MSELGSIIYSPDHGIAIIKDPKFEVTLDFDHREKAVCDGCLSKESVNKNARVSVQSNSLLQSKNLGWDRRAASSSMIREEVRTLRKAGKYPTKLTVEKLARTSQGLLLRRNSRSDGCPTLSRCSRTYGAGRRNTFGPVHH